MPSGTAGDASTAAHFQGKYERTQEGTECVAIFDGASFRVELLDAQAGLRHAPGAHREAAAQRAAELHPFPKAPSKAKRKQHQRQQPHAPAPAEEEKAAPTAAPAAPAPVAEEVDLAASPFNDIEASFFGMDE